MPIGRSLDCWGFTWRARAIACLVWSSSSRLLCRPISSTTRVRSMASPGRLEKPSSTTRSQPAWEMEPRARPRRLCWSCWARVLPSPRRGGAATLWTLAASACQLSSSQWIPSRLRSPIWMLWGVACWAFSKRLGRRWLRHSLSTALRLVTSIGCKRAWGCARSMARAKAFNAGFYSAAPSCCLPWSTPFPAASP